MKKKLLSMALACAMIMALAVPALADTSYYSHADTESTDLTQTINIAARTFVPTVKLYLPVFDGDSVVLNPYKIKYTGEGNALNGQTIASVDDPTGDAYKQVISPVYSIKNETDVRLNFAVSASASVEGEVSLSPDFVSLTETNKKAHIVVVIEKVATTTAPTITTNTAQNLDRFDTAKYETLTLKATGEAKTGTDVKYLPAVAAASTPTPNYLCFQFQGDMTRQPTKSWTADDKVSSTLVFTFTPESKADFTAKFAKTDLPKTPSAASTATIGATAGTNVVLDTNSAAKITYGATPNWSVVSTNLEGVTMASATSSGTTTHTLTIPKDTVAKVPTVTEAGTAGKTIYTTVFGFNDANGVPRTLEVTFEIARADS